MSEESERPCWGRRGAVQAPGSQRKAARALLGAREPACGQGLPRWLSGEEPFRPAGAVGSIPGWGRSPGEGNGKPLQNSCLGEPMDKGAWAMAHGVAKSWPQLDSYTTRSEAVRGSRRSLSDTCAPRGCREAAEVTSWCWRVARDPSKRRYDPVRAEHLDREARTAWDSCCRVQVGGPVGLGWGQVVASVEGERWRVLEPENLATD